MASSSGSGSEEPIKNIVLVGRAGNGKSATANSLIGRKMFTSGTQASGVTMTCQSYRAVTPSGPIINVIDTPGLFDLITKPDVISKEIVRCLALAEEGLHAVVLVLSVRTRITSEEEESLCTLQFLFGAKILDYLIVVFTGGDELEDIGHNLKDYLRTCPPFLMNIFSLCGHRKVLFNNRSKDEVQKNRQIAELLDYVALIEWRNDGKPYTKEIHRQITEETKRHREEELKLENAKHLAIQLEEEKAKLKVEHERIMNELQGRMEFLIQAANEQRLEVLRLRGDIEARGRCNIM